MPLLCRLNSLAVNGDFVERVSVLYDKLVGMDLEANKLSVKLTQSCSVVGGYDSTQRGPIKLSTN